MNDHPVTTSTDEALCAAESRGAGASNLWVQWWNYADGDWETMQLQDDVVGAATLFGKMSAAGGRVILGADDAVNIIVCTSPAYEEWASAPA